METTAGEIATTIFIHPDGSVSAFGSNKQGRKHRRVAVKYIGRNADTSMAELCRIEHPRARYLYSQIAGSNRSKTFPAARSNAISREIFWEMARRSERVASIPVPWWES